MRSWLTFFKDGQEIGKGRWDGRGNARSASDEVNWDYRHFDFDMAVCRTKGGKILTVMKEKNCGRR
jgi:hypothetical protein